MTTKSESQEFTSRLELESQAFAIGRKLTELGGQPATRRKPGEGNLSNVVDYYEGDEHIGRTVYRRNPEAFPSSLPPIFNSPASNRIVAASCLYGKVVHDGQLFDAEANVLYGEARSDFLIKVTVGVHHGIRMSDLPTMQHGDMSSALFDAAVQQLTGPRPKFPGKMV